MSNKIKHTPGPWKVDEDAYAVVVGYEGLDVAITETGSARSVEEDAANARLIAAAPELLAACEAAANDGVDMKNDYRLSRETLEKLVTAIAKAKGGAA